MKNSSVETSFSGHPVFGWSVKLMNQLTYPQKFLLIGILFLLVLISPMTELTLSVNDSLKLTNSEKTGILAVRKGRQLLGDLALQKETAILKKDLELLKAVHREHNDVYLADSQLNAVSASLKALETDNRSSAWETALTSTHAYIDQVGAASQMVLDPVIDSFSLMDVGVVQYPTVVDLAGQIEHIASSDSSSRRRLMIAAKAVIDNRVGIVDSDITAALGQTKDKSIEPRIKPAYQAFKTAYDDWSQYLDSVLESSDSSISSSQVTTKTRQMVSTYSNLVVETSHAFEKILNQRLNDTAPRLYRAVIAAVVILGIIVYLLTGFYLAVKEAVRSLGVTAKSLSEGDLTARLHLDTRDELSELNTSFNAMTESFSKLILSLRQEISTVSSASEELSSTSQQMKIAAEKMTAVSSTTASLSEEIDSGMRTVAAAVEESSANIHQVFSVSEQVSQNSVTAEKAMEQVAQNMQLMTAASEEMTLSVETVAAAIEEMTSSLNEVARNASQASKISQEAQSKAEISIRTIDSLGQAANEIDNVVDVIKSIASQTNLLALNATIEAASAGEAGKGFAVVANEVKELAKQSAIATEDIRNQIQAVQKDTRDAVEAIQEISTVIVEMNQINTVIASAVEEQASTVREISRSVTGSAQAAKNVSQNIQDSSSKVNDVSVRVKESIQGVKEISNNLEQLTLGTNEIAKSAASSSSNVSEMSQGIDDVQKASTETSQVAVTVLKTSQQLSSLAAKLESQMGMFRL